MSLDSPEHADTAVVQTIPRRYVAWGLVLLVIILVAVLIVVHDLNQTNAASDVETVAPTPPSMTSALSHLPAAVTSAVGVTSPDNAITAPTATGNTALWQSGTPGGTERPVVFFYGAEFAPYAAAERWPLVVALSRFGQFKSLGLAQSSSSVAFSNISTFTFWKAKYSSSWLDLQAVERYGSLDPEGIAYMPLQTPTRRQAASVEIYDQSVTTFPLLDIANHYDLVGSSFSPSVLTGLTQSQIVSDLASPASPVTQAILASANEITAAICTVTDQQPVASCSARGVDAADLKMGIDPHS